MFEKIPGLASERAVRLTALVEQCRPLLDQDAGMDAVQRLLHDRGIAVMDAIRVTRELMGAGPDTLQQATTVVLTSPVRTDAPPAHQELVDMLERAQDIADAARARARTDETTIIAIDGPGGSGKTTLAAKVAELLDGATVIHGDDFYRPMPEHEREQLDAQQGYQHYFDWQRLRDQVLAPLRAGRPARYQRFDWATGKLADWREVSPGTMVIVEGVYAARPELPPDHLRRHPARGLSPTTARAWTTLRGVDHALARRRRLLPSDHLAPDPSPTPRPGLLNGNKQEAPRGPRGHPRA